ncbi:MAG: DUF2920 family protein [Thermincola sp.]|nr:DUF2920 family protein [Thermincola sp.]MDT3703375.1 DUF2920 family protein [Thermincola sp.]
MAKEYTIEVIGHPSIYQYKERKLQIYFSAPDHGVNSESGLLLLIPGFGANANSKIYKKMRNTFADMYNLVTIQCDYFGWEFMQTPKPNQLNKLNIPMNKLDEYFTEEEIRYILAGGSPFQKMLQLKKKTEFYLPLNMNLNEDLTNFNDMGIMQSIDNITAVLVVMEILKDNNLMFNEGRIHTYGHSHGAYLAYLCNAFAPDLFSMIIDNSAWLYPIYINFTRELEATIAFVKAGLIFSYLAKTMPQDEEILSLPSLYKKFINKCQIICFHGNTDKIISHIDKHRFCHAVSSCVYNEITQEDIDGEIFKSTRHGLDADFLRLFNYVMEKYKNCFGKKNAFEYPVFTIETAKKSYNFDYSSGRPVVKLN